jgi:hypothetical protein
MTVIYGIGLTVALLAGAALGWLITFAYYERAAARYREYEREMADACELHAARAIVRRMKLDESLGDD